ncbi:hypothetical protein LTR36_006590 [Oleoguttula mirabilis]|uniref:Uncharacterized protein n=1 Tax=Oleoguttula mirabilis TaxID=1507867 RepID=A0AAV9JC87_9PEZI|nr:hypothetical protein LTR36_006590 [Oleoguttula mirabilis]
MTSQDAPLYGAPRPRKLAGGKEISSSTTLSFTSQLSSLISSSNSNSTSKPAPSRHKPKKDDIFSKHNRNSAKRAKRDLEDSPAFEQKHTTNGEALDGGLWERSKRKMEEKARLYAAMKRGDVEDADERYAVDFDRKWAEKQEKAEDSEQDDEDDLDGQQQDVVEYTDEFGRTRTGTAAEAAQAERVKRGKNEPASDRFTARPSAPTNVIYGDTIQHQAFDPDQPVAAQMEELAKKRDKSLTPPPEQHFDASAENRTKGTGFFQFSGDAEERKRQMENLESERAETERRRQQREGKLDERRKQIEARRAEISQRRGKRRADDFLDQLGEELSAKPTEGDGVGMGMMERIEAAVQKEEDET